MTSHSAIRSSDFAARKFRVACVIDTLNAGGAQTNAITFARGLREYDIETVFISSGGVLEERCNDYGFTTYRVSMNKISSIPLSVSRMCTVLQTAGIHVVHSHTPGALVVGSISAHMNSIPFIHSIHGRIDVVPDVFKTDRSNSRMINGCYSSVLSCADMVVAVSDEMLDYASRELKVPMDRIRVVQNAVDALDSDSSHSEVQNSLGSLGKHCRASSRNVSNRSQILWLGRISRDKMDSIETSVGAVSSLVRSGVDVRLVIAGGGPHFESVKKKIETVNAEIGREVIETKGIVLDIRKEILESTLVIASGRSAMEAIALGRPVILLSNNGYCPQITSENVSRVAATNFSGRGIQPHPTIDNLSKDILRVINDSSSGQGMSSPGYSYINEHYSISVLGRKMLEVYESVIPANNLRREEARKK